MSLEELWGSHIHLKICRHQYCTRHRSPQAAQTAVVGFPRPPFLVPVCARRLCRHAGHAPKEGLRPRGQEGTPRTPARPCLCVERDEQADLRLAPFEPHP